MAQKPNVVQAQEGVKPSSEIRKGIAGIEEKIRRLKVKRTSLVRELPIRCYACGQNSSTKEWAFIQMLYFDVDYPTCMSKRPPRECFISCPKCKKERNLDDDFEVLLHITECGVKQLFASAEERHER